MRVQKSDLVDGIAIAFGKIATDSFAVCKAVPKFPVAAELQTFQHRVLSAREVLRVGACHDLFPRLFGGKGHAFQILHRKPLFAVTEIGIHGGELARFEFEHRNRGAPIARGSLFGSLGIGIPCGFACVKLRCLHLLFVILAKCRARGRLDRAPLDVFIVVSGLWSCLY